MPGCCLPMINNPSCRFDALVCQGENLLMTMNGGGARERMMFISLSTKVYTKSNITSGIRIDLIGKGVTAARGLSVGC